MIRNFKIFKESFVPKNLEDRAKKYDLIKAEKAKEKQTLVEELQKIVNNLKTSTIENEAEKFFVERFKNCRVEFQENENSKGIFFFDKKNNYLANYDQEEENYFWISYKNIWKGLEEFFGYYRSEQPIRNATKKWVEKYFGLTNVYAIDVYHMHDYSDHN